LARARGTGSAGRGTPRRLPRRTIAGSCGAPCRRRRRPCPPAFYRPARHTARAPRRAPFPSRPSPAAETMRRLEVCCCEAPWWRGAPRAPRARSRPRAGWTRSPPGPTISAILALPETLRLPIHSTPRLYTRHGRGSMKSTLSSPLFFNGPGRARLPKPGVPSASVRRLGENPRLVHVRALYVRTRREAVARDAVVARHARVYRVP
jgi:hypothetical protein